MIHIDNGCRILVAVDPVDFRKAFDGLCGVVNNFLGGTPTDGTLFVFFNRRRDRVKLLVWDTDGFWLHYKRLECGTFEHLSTRCGTRSVVLSKQEIELLLNGIVLGSVRRRKRYTLPNST